MSTINSEKDDLSNTVNTFGDLVNADHVLAQSPEACGLFGERDALIVVDRYSEYIDAYPLMSKQSEDVHASLVDFFGTDNPTDVYIWSDSAPELIKAVHNMGLPHGKALPGRHQNNSWCERQIRNIVQTRVAKHFCREASTNPCDLHSFCEFFNN